MSYADPDYLATLSHLGERLDLTRSGAAVYLRALPQPWSGHDAIGPYPWLDCRDIEALAADLGDVDRRAVSTVAVLSPLRGEPGRAQRAAFPHLLRPFKTHWVCDFSRELTVDAHHRRQSRRAQQRFAFSLEAGSAPLAEFPQLYLQLGQRHQLSWPSRFSADDLRTQLGMRHMLAACARREGEVVAAQLWMCEDGWAIYHLGASTTDGYRHGASHGLMAAALEHFRAAGYRGLWLGGCAGTGDDANDGLARYKRGWSNTSVQVWIGGRIGQAERYKELAAGRGDDDYFPAYRAAPASVTESTGGVARDAA